MKVTLDIPDEIAAVYETYGKKIEKTLLASINTFKDFDPSKRVVVIPEKERQALEALFNRQVETAKDLVNQCKAALSSKIEGIDFNLTPNQLERLRMQAEFEGYTGKRVGEFAKEKLAEGVRYAIEGY